MISNRQYFRRGGRQHSSSSTLPSRILATRQPQFLIRYQQLEINVNHSKQTLTPISNPQKTRNMFSRKRTESASRLGPSPAFSLNRFRFAIISNRHTTEFKKTDNPMKTNAITISNRNNNSHRGGLAALALSLLFLAALLPLSASAQQSPLAPDPAKSSSIRIAPAPAAPTPRPSSPWSNRRIPMFWALPSSPAMPG